MKILITGVKGFIGKNLYHALFEIKEGHDMRSDHCICGFLEDIHIFGYSKEMGKEKLEEYCKDCDFIFHFAGVNRPLDKDDFQKENIGFTIQLLDILNSYKNNCPIVFSSSAQVSLEGRYSDSLYGKSKRKCEDILFDENKKNGRKIYIYRFPNVFGKWCKPNYNSVVATFSYNISHTLPIRIDNPKTELNLVYIDDVVDEMISLISNMYEREDISSKIYKIKKEYHCTLEKLVDLLSYFYKNIQSKEIPELHNGFEKALYSTFLCYLPERLLKFNLITKKDKRGSFTEVFSTKNSGQISVNIIKPGMTKGQHWHNSKNEKFVVVSGNGIIRMKPVETFDINDNISVIEYVVSGADMQIVTMIPGYTHSITNLSKEEDMVVLIWANEVFDKNKPDTFYKPV